MPGRMPEVKPEIAKHVGVDKDTSADFCNSAKIRQSLGFKTDPEFTDIDHPLYDVWKAKTSSNATDDFRENRNAAILAKDGNIESLSDDFREASADYEGEDWPLYNVWKRHR